MTITEVAEIVGISPKTIVRWEKVGKVRKAKRDRLDTPPNPDRLSPIRDHDPQVG